MNKQIIEESIDKLYDFVVPSIGPNGTYSVINDGYNTFVTKDGATIAKYLTSTNKEMNAILDIIKQASLKTNSEVGDGTTSSILLTTLMYYAKGINLEEIPIALDKVLKKYTKEITSKEEAINIATISCAGDSDLGSIIGELVYTLKDTGIIEVLESDKNKDYFTFSEGSSFPSSYVSPVFINNAAKKIVELHNPVILTFSEKVENFADELGEDLKFAANLNKPLLVIAPEFSDEVLDLTYANLNAGVKICLAYAPGFGETRINNLQDIEILTYNGQYNSANKVIISNTKLDIIQPQGLEKERIARSLFIQQLIDSCEDENLLPKLKQRLANFNGKSGKLFIYAKTKAEMEEKMARVDDAICATRASLSSGYVPGGGFIYRNIYDELSNKEAASVFRDAVKTIQGVHAGNVTSEATFNLKTNTQENWETTSVIEPVAVVRESILNAISISKILNNINNVVLFTPQSL